MDKIDIAIKLSDKLGWGDMPVHIALPAIDEILAISQLPLGSLLALEDYEIFGFLAGIDVAQDEYVSFISLRGEIEEYMRNGVPHIEAINEWWK